MISVLILQVPWQAGATRFHEHCSLIEHQKQVLLMLRDVNQEDKKRMQFVTYGSRRVYLFI